MGGHCAHVSLLQGLSTTFFGGCDGNVFWECVVESQLRPFTYTRCKSDIVSYHLIYGMITPSNKNRNDHENEQFIAIFINIYNH